jgi:hypothetical protein
MRVTESFLRVEEERHGEVALLRPAGLLTSSTYRSLRDAIIKAALDEPAAVVVDVEELGVPSESAWTAFTSARWHVSVWPDVPVMLVCADPAQRRTIVLSGVSRYVPVHATLQSAVDALSDSVLYGRRRARLQLPASRVSLRQARTSITDWLTAWDLPDLIPVVCTMATVFIDNVLAHTESAPVLIVENHRATVTVAVEDESPRPAVLHEDPVRGADIVSGLGMVSALCRSWGSTPTPTGKTVWALVGDENQL